MKIGTLTFHRAANYGGALQCYALVKYLRSIGCDAEVADYRSKAIDSAYRLFKTNSFKQFVWSLLHIGFRYKSNRMFLDFRNKYLRISEKVFFDSKDLYDQYDVVLIGSDQVWSKRINKGFDPVFWGNIKGKTRVISYAASMGTDHDYTKEEKSLISKYLNNFYAISVREDSLNQELSCLTNKDIRTTIDPTLLLSIEDYQQISETPKEKNYVLYYQMEYNMESKYRVQEIAKQLGCTIVVIGGKKEKYDVPMSYYNSSNVSPTLFVGYILNAKCVFASSFHGTALSIAMKKDFYFLANYETDRAENLLLHVGAHDRMIPSNKPLTFSHIDYSQVGPLLDLYKSNSIDFIKQNIAL